MCAIYQIDTCNVVQNQHQNISDIMRVDFDGVAKRRPHAHMIEMPGIEQLKMMCNDLK